MTLLSVRHASLVAFALTLAACAASQPQPGSAAVTEYGGSTHGGMMHAGMAGPPRAESSSPMAVTGTSVSEVDVPQGAALEFVTIGDATEVQRRVARAADFHNQRGSAAGCTPTTEGSSMGMMGEGRTMGGPGAAGMMGSGMGSGMMGNGMMGNGTMGNGMMEADSMPASHARMEPMPNGARLVFTVDDPKDVDALRRHARMQVVHASNGQCSMLATAASSSSPTGTKKP